jgi:hypothetical protein
VVAAPGMSVNVVELLKPEASSPRTTLTWLMSPPHHRGYRYSRSSGQHQRCHRRQKEHSLSSHSLTFLLYEAEESPPLRDYSRA